MELYFHFSDTPSWYGAQLKAQALSSDLIRRYISVVETASLKAKKLFI
jgi:hypothetical protein